MIFDFSKTYTEDEFSEKFNKCPICDLNLRLDFTDYGSEYNCKQCKLNIILNDKKVGYVYASWVVGDYDIVMDYSGVSVYSTLRSNAAWWHTSRLKKISDNPIIDISEIFDKVEKFKVLS